MVSIANEVSLKPLAKTVLRHLRSRGTISNAEAMMAYGTMRLAAVIHDLRKVGYAINTELRDDASGHRYSRYSMPKGRKR